MSSSYPSLVIADGAIAYWRLGETSGTTAVDVIGGHNGTIIGGVTLNQPGPLADGNTAMAFDGSTGRIDTIWSLLFQLPYSAEAWIKPTTLPPQALVVGNYQGTTTYLGTNQQFYGGSQLALFAWSLAATPNEAYTSGPLLTVGAWYHVAWVVTAADTRFYVNGQLAGTVARTFTAETAQLVRIGGSTSGEYFAGLIDEVAIYPTALTPTQIAAHYAARTWIPNPFPVGSYPYTVVADGAVAYWRLGETSGTTANDSIGTAHGTISGGVTLGQAGALADGNKAMAFDGTSGKIICPAVSIPAACTIEAWVKTTGSAALQTIVSTRPPTTTDTLIATIADSGPALIYVGPQPVQGTRNLIDGQFHHVVFVLTGTQTTIYSDGTLDSSPQAQPHLTGSFPVQIGYEQTTYFFNGTLDDIAIYPTALTPTQIAAHYAARTWIAFGPTIADLRYRWCRFVRPRFRQVTR
jgi:hypothetical protein